MKIKYLIQFTFITGLISCTAKIDNSEHIEQNMGMVNIFNRSAERHPKAILEALTRDSLLVIQDDLQIDSLGQVSGVVYFNRVGFGVVSHHDDDPAHGDYFHFISSRADDEAYNNIVAAIEHYYGPMEEDEWHSAVYSTSEAYFKIRPLHSEEGGLSMIWAY